MISPPSVRPLYMLPAEAERLQGPSKHNESEDTCPSDRAVTRARLPSSSTLTQPSQGVVNLDLEHHRRDSILDHRRLKQLRQLALLFGAEVILIDIVEIKIVLAGQRETLFDQHGHGCVCHRITLQLLGLGDNPFLHP